MVTKKTDLIESNEYGVCILQIMLSIVITW